MQLSHMRYLLPALALAVLICFPHKAVAETSDFKQIMLSMHNAERAVQHVPDLVWDEGFAAEASRHAAYMAQAGVLMHSDQSGNARLYGENLWMGTRGAYSYADMIGMFLAERRYYMPRAVPDISTTGHWKDAGHYSQIIWRTTTRVGCGVASGPDFDALVCHYDPAGNVWGRRAHDMGPDEVRTIYMASN